MYPITLDVLEFQWSDTEWADADVAAVPDKVTVEDELFALLLAAKDAVNDPEATGANTIGTFADFPEAIDNGKRRTIRRENIIPSEIQLRDGECASSNIGYPQILGRRGVHSYSSKRQLSRGKRNLGRG